jgi:L-methionine (R)-S-oxide reductase
MAETLTLPSHSTKDEIYAALLPQIEAVISGVDDLIANLANVAAMLKQAFNFHWVGFLSHDGPATVDARPFSGPAGLRLHSFRERCLWRSRA